MGVSCLWLLLLLLVSWSECRSFFRRVPVENRVQCKGDWTFNPTLRRGSVGLVAGRSGPSRSSSVVRMIDFASDETQTPRWCRQFRSVFALSVFWPDTNQSESSGVLMFASASKGHERAEEGPFAVLSDDELPVLFLARLNETTGNTISATRLSSGSFDYPVGMFEDGDLLTAHLTVWGNHFRGADCVGPMPFVHSVSFRMADLRVTRTCLDWACNTELHCNATNSSVLEPSFGQHRLNGWPLTIVFGILTMMMIWAVTAAFTSAQ